ncbi:MAG: type II 3-dehydroquinate dehydratase [Angelakisella sp.]|nr:type II 3-dehydroquinate dehydratase [Angelakisella sp.]
MKLLVLSGPNLNMLGIREPGIYGNESYQNLIEYVRGVCAELGDEAEFFQSNHEGALVDAIQNAYGRMDGIIINPAAYTHTSVAILDAVKAVGIPTVEVHLTDIAQREEFRKVSYVSVACVKSICGLGFEGYRQAAVFLHELLAQTKAQ